jgi:hypothetical protein
MFFSFTAANGRLYRRVEKLVPETNVIAREHVERRGIM